MLDFNADANWSLSSEKAVATLLEKTYWIKIKLVSDQHKKYDLVIIDWNWYFENNTTIDVKANLNINYNSVYLEAVNIWWNNWISDDDYNIKQILNTMCEIKSYWWSFYENIKDTDYIFLLDKDWQNIDRKGNRIWYLIPQIDILNNNMEKDIINGLYPVIWNKISYRWNSKWRSAYIIASLNNFENKIKFKF